MKGFNIHLNSIIDIIAEDGKTYKSRVQEIKNKEIFIDMPMENGEYILLKRGAEVNSILYNEKVGMLYKLKSKVLERVIDGNLRLYKITWPYEIKKLQRRNYVRVNTTKGIKYKKKEDIIYSNGLVLDLSGGGMKIKLDKILSVGEEVELLIDLNGKFAKIKGEVRRVDKDKDSYIVGFEFTDIGEAVRDRIIQIVFSIMRRQIEVL